MGQEGRGAGEKKHKSSRGQGGKGAREKKHKSSGGAGVI